MEDNFLDGDAVHVILNQKRFGGSQVIKEDLSGGGANAKVEAVAERQGVDLRQRRHLQK